MAVGDLLLGDALACRLDGPVLFVRGADDDVYPPAVGEDTCQRLPDGRLEVVPEAGHFVWLAAPEHTTETLSGFLGRESTAGE